MPKDEWYYSIDGVQLGPISFGELAHSVQSGKIRPTDLVRRSDLHKWVPASSLGLGQATGPVDPPPLPPPLPSSSADGTRTNAQLPAFANWIVTYCLALRPAFVFFYFVFTCVLFASSTGQSPAREFQLAFDIVDLLGTIGITVVLVIAGLRLRDIQPSASKWLIAGLMLSLAFAALTLVLSFGLILVEEALIDAQVAVADAQGVAVSEALFEEASPVEFMVGFLLFLLSLVFVLFELVALIWLWQKTVIQPMWR